MNNRQRTAQNATIKYMAEKYNADLDSGDVKYINKNLAVYDGRDYWLGAGQNGWKMGKLLEVYDDSVCHLYEEKR